MIDQPELRRHARAEYMRALHDLKRACSQEIDRAQYDEPLTTRVAEAFEVCRRAGDTARQA